MANDETLRIACAQVSSSKSKEDNLATIEKFAEKASRSTKADMLVFPEVFMFYSPSEESLDERSSKAEPIDGPFIKKVQQISKKNNISITVGMHESVAKKLKTYNATLTTSSQGEILNVYRKTHLYDAFNFKESEKIVASDNKLRVFEYNGFKIGTIVCYEVRFPEIARTLALKGAEIIIVPSAWVRGYDKEEHWLTLVKARALENTVYVATSNQIGNIYTGISCFVDPFGLIVQRATDEEGLIIGEASKERLRRVRELLPVLAQRNRTIYEI